MHTSGTWLSIVSPPPPPWDAGKDLTVSDFGYSISVPHIWFGQDMPLTPGMQAGRQVACPEGLVKAHTFD